MSDGDLKLGVFEDEAFFSLLEGRRSARQAGGQGGALIATSRPDNRPSPAPARTSKGSAEKRMQTMLRVVAKTPEVMVKVTGRDSSVAQVKAHLAYLAREEDSRGELNDGMQLYGKAGVMEASELLRDPEAEEADRKMTIHVMFSMPAGAATGQQVLDAARATAKQSFEGHEYVMVLHEDKPHKHVHMVIATRGADGRQLRHYKPQLQEWRSTFAAELRERGVAAEATPRVIRGVTEKSVSRSVRAIRDQRGSRPPARTDVAKALEAFSAEPPKSPPPWLVAAEKNRQIVDKAWRQFADDLATMGGATAERGAQLVKDYADGLPPVRFERDRLADKAKDLRDRERETTAGPDQGQHPTNRGRSR